MPSPQQLVTIGKYPNSWEAQAVCNRLIDAGLVAFVADAEMATTFSYGSIAIGGAKVQVPSDQEQRARAVLEEDRISHHQRSDWICQRCDEKNAASFDFCWSCTKQREDTDLPATEASEPEEALYPRVDASDDQDEEVHAPRFDDQLEDFADRRRRELEGGRRPYRPPTIAEPSGDWAPPTRSPRDSAPFPAVGGDLWADDEAAGATVDRAFRAAVLGVVLFPPLLHLYSIGLLARLAASGAPLPDEKRWRLVVTWMLNLLVLATAVLMISSMW